MPILLLYMFNGALAMPVSTVFVNNRTQAVRLLLDVRLPERASQFQSDREAL